MWVKQIESELDDYEWLKETIHVLHVMIEALNMQPSRGPTITSSEQNEWQLLLRSLSDDEKTWDDLVNGEVVQTDMTSSEWHKKKARNGMTWNINLGYRNNLVKNEDPAIIYSPLCHSKPVWLSFILCSGGQSTQIKYLSKSTDTYTKILLQ